MIRARMSIFGWLSICDRIECYTPSTESKSKTNRKFYFCEESLKNNFGVLKDIIIKANELKSPEESSGLGYLWKSIPSNLIKQAINGFLNHPECMLTDKRPLIQYIEWLEEQGDREFDILLRFIIF